MDMRNKALQFAQEAVDLPAISYMDAVATSIPFQKEAIKNPTNQSEAIQNLANQMEAMKNRTNQTQVSTRDISSTILLHRTLNVTS